MYVLLLGIGVPAITFVLLIVEGVLGWFAFSVNVLSSYPFMVDRATGPMPGLTDTQSDALIMMVSPRCKGNTSVLPAYFLLRCRFVGTEAHPMHRGKTTCTIPATQVSQKCTQCF